MHLTVIILVSLVLTALFSGLYTAYCTANKIYLEIGGRANPFFTWLVRMMTESGSLLFITLVFGFTLSLVVFSVTTTIFMERLIPGSLIGPFLRVALEIFITSLIVLLFGLFIPKPIFRISPNNILILFSLPLALIYILLFPLLKILNFTLINIFNKKVRISETQKDTLFPHFDFLQLEKEEEMNHTNIINDVKKEVILIRNTLDYSKVKLREIMVPRNEIALLDINSDTEILKKRFIETGFSRILFYEDNKDNIVGYVHTSAIFQKARQIKPFLKNVLIVPETMAANRLLSRFIREHRSIALVVDEFGGTAGLVTTEDILEEIFGEIEDEHDTRVIFERKINEREFILSGRYEIDALNEKYKWNIPESDQYETLAGFILYHYESIPKVNEMIKIGNWRFKVLKATNTKIELLKFTLNDHN